MGRAMGGGEGRRCAGPRPRRSLGIVCQRGPASPGKKRSNAGARPSREEILAACITASAASRTPPTCRPGNPSLAGAARSRHASCVNPLSRRSLLKGLVAVSACHGARLLGATAASAARLPRATPERHGVSSAGLLALVDALDRLEHVHGLMVLRHGHVLAEGWWAPYDAATPHELYSLSKSFTSTAVGLAVADGKLSVDDPVLRHLQDEAPSDPSSNLKSMRVRDLLTMTTGHQTEPPSAPDKMTARSFLATPVPFKPGTHFLYNTPATFMQSALVQKVTGKTVHEYLKGRLLGPLGIEGSTWDSNVEGVNLGGYGLRLRTEDVARFGQLLLRGGRGPSGKALVPAAWVEAATSRQVSNGSNPRSDWDQGYGFQFWRCRHGAYRGDGAFGQFCIVLPAQDMVVAVTAGLGDMQAVLDRVWENVLPAVGRDGRKARHALRDRLEGLAIKTVQGARTSPKAASVLGRTFKLAPNAAGWESVRLEERAGGGWDLSWVARGRETRLPCGHGRWAKGEGALAVSPRTGPGPLPAEPMATSGGWTSDDTFSATVHVCSTPFRALMTMRAVEAGLRMELRTPLGFGAQVPVQMQSEG